MDSPQEALDWSAGQRVQEARPVDVRPWVAMRVEQWKRIAPMVSLGLQSATVAGVFYGLVAWRGIHPAAVLAFFAVVLSGAFVTAWLYYGPMNMRPAEQEARFKMDLRDQNLLSPKEARLLGLLIRALRRDEAAWQELEEASRRRRL